MSRKQFSLALVTSAVLAAVSNTAVADQTQTQAPDGEIEHMVVFGNKTTLNDIPGSAHLITEEDLAKFEYTDVMRVLSSVPGVYVMEEDGYGLRPNIGMRGTGLSRSEKVNIMEDGILAAPAPYASPSAYYFPTIARMQSVEVLKGTSSVKFGPRTTGGIVNMVSRQIPDQDLAGMADVAIGEDGYAKMHGYVGGNGDNIGSVFEVTRYQADGFKSINHASDDTGFTKNDILGKINFHTDEGSARYQELELKIKYSDEDSDETYMGLTDEDFDNDPYARYSASQKDNMDTEHKQIQLNHYIQLNGNMSLSSAAYYNDFHRNWYKTSKVNGMSLSSGGIEAAAAFDKDPMGDVLYVDVKANNRDYISKGIQTELNWILGDHDLSIGARYHEDEMDRFQWVDKYQMDSMYNMTLAPEDAGVPGTDSNRIDSAESIAFFVQDQWTMNDWVVTGGLRYEDIETNRLDWGKADPGRTAAPGKDVSNSLDVWMPSLGATYRINDEWLVLAGVQKGFAPPAPGNEDRQEEESWNYETGFRYSSGELYAEAVGFFSDYDNMHGNCTVAQGCDEDKVDSQTNAGEVEVKGLELTVGYSFEANGLTFPIRSSYTYTSTEFQNAFSSDFDTWGDVEIGDEMPYLPENVFFLSVGMEGQNWGVELATIYMDDMRSVAGQGDIPDDELIENRTVVDLAAHYQLDAQQRIYLTVDNLLDEEYATTRTHGSLQSGKPRTMILGYKYSF